MTDEKLKINFNCFIISILLLLLFFVIWRWAFLKVFFSCCRLYICCCVAFLNYHWSINQLFKVMSSSSIGVLVAQNLILVFQKILYQYFFSNFSSNYRSAMLNLQPEELQQLSKRPATGLPQQVYESFIL